MKKPSPLAKAEAALKDESAKKMAEKIVEKREAAKATTKSAMKKMEEIILDAEERTAMPSFSKEVERKVPEKVMDPPPIEVSFGSEHVVGEVSPANPSKPVKPNEDQLCLVRRRGTVTLARYRHGDFYASHAGFYSELVDRPDAWTAIPEF